MPDLEIIRQIIVPTPPETGMLQEIVVRELKARDIYSINDEQLTELLSSLLNIAPPTGFYTAINSGLSMEEANHGHIPVIIEDIRRNGSDQSKERLNQILNEYYPVSTELPHEEKEMPGVTHPLEVLNVQPAQTEVSAPSGEEGTLLDLEAELAEARLESFVSHWLPSELIARSEDRTDGYRLRLESLFNLAYLLPIAKEITEDPTAQASLTALKASVITWAQTGKWFKDAIPLTSDERTLTFYDPQNPDSMLKSGIILTPAAHSYYLERELGVPTGEIDWKYEFGQWIRIDGTVLNYKQIRHGYGVVDIAMQIHNLEGYAGATLLYPPGKVETALNITNNRLTQHDPETIRKYGFRVIKHPSENRYLISFFIGNEYDNTYQRTASCYYALELNNPPEDAIEWLIRTYESEKDPQKKAQLHQYLFAVIYMQSEPEAPYIKPRAKIRPEHFSELRWYLIERGALSEPKIFKQARDIDSLPALLSHLATAGQPTINGSGKFQEPYYDALLSRLEQHMPGISAWLESKLRQEIEDTLAGWNA